jgi:hypothetical protein
MAKQSGNARRAILSPTGEILGWAPVLKPTRTEIEDWSKSERGQKALARAANGKNLDPWATCISPEWSEKRGFFWKISVNPY